jgi:hypothetical protein
MYIYVYIYIYIYIYLSIYIYIYIIYIGAVLRCLEQDKKLELVSSFETLLNLSVFVEACMENKQEALNIIDGLGIFPKNSNEVQAAAQYFPSLDIFIRRIADDVLVLTLECVKVLYVLYAGGNSMRGILSDREQERYIYIYI